MPLREGSLVGATAPGAFSDILGLLKDFAAALSDDICVNMANAETIHDNLGYSRLSSFQPRDHGFLHERHLAATQRCIGEQRRLPYLRTRTRSGASLVAPRYLAAGQSLAIVAIQFA
jgi:hypothetical protein